MKQRTPGQEILARENRRIAVGVTAVFVSIICFTVGFSAMGGYWDITAWPWIAAGLGLPVTTIVLYKLTE